MAITFTPQSAVTIASILRPIGGEFAAFGTTGASMVGMTVYVDLGMFVNEGEAMPVPSQIPKYGYSIAFPSDGTTYKMSKISNQNYYFWENGYVYFARTGTNNFTVTIEALMTMDLQGMLGYTGIDTIQRLTKDGKSNPSRLNNNAPDVYSGTKFLRFLIVVADSNDQIQEYGYLDIEFNARWFNKGLNDGVAEFTDYWGGFYGVAALGTTGGFSFNQNTLMRFMCTGTWTAGGWFVIWKDTNNPNAAQYWKDTKLSIVRFEQSGSLSQVYDFDNTAFVSCSAVTTISGSNKYVDLVLDKDWFILNGKDAVYRIAFIPVKSGDYSNTFLTEQLEVTDFVLPTEGRITDTIWNYSLESNPFSKCASGIAINERLRFRIDLDKEAYNAAIITNDSTGTFDSNFMDVKLYISDYAIPDGNKFDPKDGELINNVTVLNSSDTYSLIFEILMRPEWANSIKYITRVARYKIFSTNEDNPGIYTIDEIYYQEVLAIDDYLTVDDDIKLLYMRDETGNDLTKICGDTGIIQLVFQNLTDEVYNLIGHMEDENDPYVDGAGLFDKLNNIPGLVNMDKEFILTNDPDLGDIMIARVNIDTGKLQYGKEYCFELIGINQNHIQGACPTSATVDVVLTYEGGLTCSVNYSGLSVDPKQVEVILHPVTDKWSQGIDSSYTFYETSGNTGAFLSYGSGTWKTFNINIVVKTANGCHLSGNATFQVSKFVTTDGQTITLS